MKRCFYNGHLRDGVLEQFWAEAEDTSALPPAAPLRAYRFTTAGGSAAQQDPETGLPRGCVFKIGLYTSWCGKYNPYEGKVVVMDEAHHLVRPSRQYKEQLQCLQQYLSSAKSLTLLACTGSMIEDSVLDPRKLLDSIKGDGGKHLCDEGFLSSHHKRGPAFPRQVPSHCADGDRLYAKGGL